MFTLTDKLAINGRAAVPSPQQEPVSAAGLQGHAVAAKCRSGNSRGRDPVDRGPCDCGRAKVDAFNEQLTQVA